MPAEISIRPWSVIDDLTVELHRVRPDYPRTVVPWLAFAGRLAMLFGREGTGKSTVAREAASCLSDGDAWLGCGEARPPGRTLWIGGEESPGALAAAFEDELFHVPEHVRYAPAANIDTPAVLADLVAAWQPALVVIDPMTDVLLRGVDDRAYGAVREAMLAWKSALGDAAGLALHHSHRDRDTARRDAIGEYYGGIGLASVPDLLLGFELHSKLPEDRRRDLVVAKSRIGHLRRGERLPLVYSGIGYQRRENEPDQADADLAEQVGEMRAKHSSEGKSRIATRLGIRRGGTARWRAFCAAWEQSGG